MCSYYEGLETYKCWLGIASTSSKSKSRNITGCSRSLDALVCSRHWTYELLEVEINTGGVPLIGQLELRPTAKTLQLIGIFNA